MYLNEPTAALRTLSFVLRDASGNGISPALVSGDVKVCKFGGALANAVNMPAAIAGADAGPFTLLLDPTEVNTLGPLYLQINHSGVANFMLFEMITQSQYASDTVTALLAAILDQNAPVGAQTFQQTMNIIASILAGPGDGIDGPIGSTSAVVLGTGVKHRAEFTVSSGVRRFTKLDGT